MQKLVYWALVGLSGATLLVVIVNFWLGQNNRSIQAEVNQRQQYINQSAQLARINESLVRTLAEAAIKDKDDRLRELLSQNGININTTANPPGDQAQPAVAPAQPAAPAPAATPAPAPAPKKEP